ncbi:hypothetical protein Pflav_046030 [Phytohabitans flavus]|uniref:Secreted protein n=1 Tax=Phytohabitans flavus TaxID=1076124 RepID=A0A6F8XWK5_9ACTN|nr:hypothetical protein Pflav_046030 [Phytohabitans flavus]
MTNAMHRLLAHRGRYLAVLASVLAVAAATAVALASRSSDQPQHGVVPQHLASVPGTPAEIPSQIPTAGQLPTSDTPEPLPHPSTADRTSASARTGGPTTSSGNTAPATTSTSAEEPEDLLKRQDPVPDGVAEQVEFFLGGGSEDPCTGEFGPPHITGDKSAEIPSEPILCFYGFKESQPLTVTITDPARHETTVVLQSTDSYFWTEVRVLPINPLGLYSVRAEQVSNSASHEFTLRRASSPRLLLAAPPVAVATGDDVNLYLGGFPPNSPTLLHLYNATTGHYRTSFTAPVDAHGEAHIVIDTKPDDPQAATAS